MHKLIDTATLRLMFAPLIMVILSPYLWIDVVSVKIT